MYNTNTPNTPFVSVAFSCLSSLQDFLTLITRTCTSYFWVSVEFWNLKRKRKTLHSSHFSHFYFLFSYIFTRYSFDPQIANAKRGGSNLFFFSLLTQFNYSGNKMLVCIEHLIFPSYERCTSQL